MGLFSSKPMEITDSVKSYVDDLIQSKKVVVFSKSYCPYCTKAKRAIEKYPIIKGEYIAVEIENRDDCSQIQEYLRQITGASSVPRVFINGQFIGGGDDTARLDTNGELRKKFIECKALSQ